MLKKFKVLILSCWLLFLPKLHAGFGQDTLLLATLCSTTASQLAELSELLETQKQITEQFTSVANAINEKIDFAERLQYHIEELVSLQQLDVQDLGSLVDSVRRLKGTLIDTKEYVANLEMEIVGAKIAKAENKKERNRNSQKQRMAMRRAALPSTSSTKDIQLATAKTNAYMLDEQIRSNNSLLRIEDHLIDMKTRDNYVALKQQEDKNNWEKYYNFSSDGDLRNKRRAR